MDSARYEKNRFEEVYRKLEQHNEAIRVEMGRIIDQSNQAYDQREEAQNKIISGKEKADKVMHTITRGQESSNRYYENV